MVISIQGRVVLSILKLVEMFFQLVFIVKVALLELLLFPSGYHAWVMHQVV